MALRFHTTPSQIEEEEDALLYCAVEGMSILDAFAARDRFFITKQHCLSADQIRLLQRVEEAMPEEEKGPESDDRYSDEELTAMGIKVD